jgi:hypothetical protein
MAGGMFTKQADYLSARYLNDVNDAAQGGTITTAPTGLSVSQAQQTMVGDRIVLDDATAFALSDSAVGTLYGGIYMYVNVAAGTAATSVRGCVAFFLASGITHPNAYTVSMDPQPTTTNPTYVLGIFINGITKLNYGWVQIAGVASVLFDTTTITATTAGSMVSAKASATQLGAADNAATVSQITVAALLGVSVGTVTAATVTQVALTRGFGRI